MMKLAIPVKFFIDLGDKPPIIRILWIKWIAEYADKVFEPSFADDFQSKLKELGKETSLETIKQAIEFGRPYFGNGFEVITAKKRGPNKKPMADIVTLDIISKVLIRLNDCAGTDYRMSASSKECISQRIKEGYELQDFYKVIEKKCRQWLNTERAQFLRPITLFGKKFDIYLNEPDQFIIPKRTTIDVAKSATAAAAQYLNRGSKNTGGE